LTFFNKFKKALILMFWFGYNKGKEDQRRDSVQVSNDEFIESKIGEIERLLDKK
jgi:hypothetical protein